MVKKFNNTTHLDFSASDISEKKKGLQNNPISSRIMQKGGIMDLDDYFLERRKANRKFRESHFAKSLKMDKTYLSHIKIGTRVPSMKLAKRIEEASGGKVNALELVERNYQMQKERLSIKLINDMIES